MIPIRFAQTIVDEPKYGASSREAVISVASAPIPAPNTSAPSAKLPGRSRPTASSEVTSRGRRRARSRRAFERRARRWRRRRAPARARNEHRPSASHDAASPWPPVARDGGGSSARSRRDRAGDRRRGGATASSWGLAVPQGNSRNAKRRACGTSRRHGVICLRDAEPRSARAAGFPVPVTSPDSAAVSRSSSVFSSRSRHSRAGTRARGTAPRSP